MVVLVAYEASLRGAGFTPSIRDDATAWSVTLEGVDSDSVVLVGTSRIQADVDPAEWGGIWGEKPVQLAIAGGSPLPMLEHLAADPAFRGTVILDALPRILFDGAGTREQTVREWLAVDHDLRRSPARMSESWLRLLLDAHLVWTRMSPWQFFKRRFLRTDPSRIPYVTMASDRFMQLDFRKVDVPRRIDTIERQIREQGHPAMGPELETLMRRLEAAVSSIRSRGGRVLLVHLPHDGRIRALEDRLYPRAEYWDAMVGRIDAPAIHFADEPALRRYPCPDGSHIDVRRTAGFTRTLARIARARLSSRSPAP